jgi:hypothetical protein
VLRESLTAILSKYQQLQLAQAKDAIYEVADLFDLSTHKEFLLPLLVEKYLVPTKRYPARYNFLQILASRRRTLLFHLNMQTFGVYY